MASNFEFYSPTRVIFGKDTEQRVGALVREYGGTRVLIVYGGKSAVRSGVLDRAENSLAEAGISSWTLGGVVPNPHLDKVYEGIRIGEENSIDFLLAVGGGSVIDTAKAIAYGLAEPEKDVWELYEHTRTASKCLPVASILTIAAAGSETSNSSVITRVDTHQKRAYNDDISRPKFALMDPELTKTLPDYQTESGCADIMMHTMERYFTNGGNMELTDALAEGLLRAVRLQGLPAPLRPLCPERHGRDRRRHRRGDRPERHRRHGGFLPQHRDARQLPRAGHRPHRRADRRDGPPLPRGFRLRPRLGQKTRSRRHDRHLPRRQPLRSFFSSPPGAEYFAYSVPGISLSFVCFILLFGKEVEKRSEKAGVFA